MARHVRNTGAALLEKLSADLTGRFGRGFSRPNLQRFREFYLRFPPKQIRSTLSSESRSQDTAHDPLDSVEQFRISDSGIRVRGPGRRIPSALVTLRLAHRPSALDRSTGASITPKPCGVAGRSVNSTARSPLSSTSAPRFPGTRPPCSTRGGQAKPGDALTADEQVRDPLVLEFLGLKDEYSEYDLEEALVHHLESFLLELGGEFAFIGRQRRLRIGDEWYRVDLLFFHRRLRCLIVIDLKVGKFTHADAGQMHLYLNYAREHWTQPGENPPVGLILCSERNEAVARYALEGLPTKILAREYRLALPDEKRLAAEIEQTRERLESRRSGKAAATKRA